MSMLVMACFEIVIDRNKFIPRGSSAYNCLRSTKAVILSCEDLKRYSIVSVGGVLEIDPETPTLLVVVSGLIGQEAVDAFRSKLEQLGGDAIKSVSILRVVDTEMLYRPHV